MLLQNKKCLLFIHPSGKPSDTPIFDSIFLKLYYALHVLQTEIGVCDEEGFSLGTCTKGVHDCTGEGCSSSSKSHDYKIHGTGGNYLYTNSLSLHYLAYHREDVPQSELDKIQQILAEPPQDFQTPDKEILIETSKNKSTSYWNSSLY